MKNLIILLAFLSLLSCKKEKDSISNQTILKNINLNPDWKGIYHFEATNRDNAKTVYDININSLNDILININEGGYQK
ncbi:hypothetical protein [Chryseobacterium polytrichastri]|uniref:Uncharacterized protein n=1 Tax=Chryseobacterium polytrichastri TaxID=1302687 RepID=A0A1M7JPB1_9FLAO|nr:hypothetical protein [Chryseobacterium polytrichastri]SHM54862.1 hypothetical protein SAMN05444267_10546 [Chryseobacterium polytrichastri]